MLARAVMPLQAPCLLLGLACGLHAQVSWQSVKSVGTVPIPVLRPAPAAETAPVAHNGDAGDDPAVWIHPTDPGKSLILGTDKKGGIHAWGLDGKTRAIYGDGLRPNNVDVKHAVRIGPHTVDVAGAATRAQGLWGFMLWIVDPTTRNLLPALTLPFQVMGGRKEPYGSTLYRRAKDGVLFVFVTAKDGTVEQYRIDLMAPGTIVPVRVRKFDVGGQVEGCVCDDEYGRFFVGEEDVAIWRYGAEPNDLATHASRVMVASAKIGPHRFLPDVEGLSLYYGSDGTGYVLASMQGENRFWVFERTGDHRLVAIIDPVASGKVDDVSASDGLVVVSSPLGRRYPAGILVVHDDINPGANQSYKMFHWDTVAGWTLRVDKGFDPRRAKWRR